MSDGNAGLEAIQGFQAGYESKVSMVNKAVDLEKKQDEIKQQRMNVEAQKFDMVTGMLRGISATPKEFRPKMIEQAKQKIQILGIPVNDQIWDVAANDNYVLPLSKNLANMLNLKNPDQKAAMMQQLLPLLGAENVEKFISGVMQGAAEYDNKLGQIQASKESKGSSFTPAQETIDKKFGEFYADYAIKGSYAGTQDSLSKLTDARQKMQNMVGKKLLGKTYQDVFNPEFASLQEQITSTVMDQMRPILGAQFTEGEGKRLIEQSFNPKLPMEMNLQKLDFLMQRVTSVAKANEKAIQYYEGEGKGATLTGYKAGIPAIEYMQKLPRTKISEEEAQKIAAQKKAVADKIRAADPKYRNMTDQQILDLSRQKGTSNARKPAE